MPADSPAHREFWRHRQGGWYCQVARPRSPSHPRVWLDVVSPAGRLGHVSFLVKDFMAAYELAFPLPLQVHRGG